MVSTTTGTGWADLPSDLLGCVMARLPFPGDRARICAACRAWRSAARRHVRHQPPWIVLPDCSICTTGCDGAFFDRIPGLPAENVTCLAAAADVWLALDCTDDAFRRTPTMDTYCPDTRNFIEARPDVKHKHTYMLHNPFSGVTVPLPELDAVVGHVAETFEIRKVLMRSTADDVIAVTTNNCNCNVILCHPGKGTFVLPHYRVVDVAFMGDTLYGTTSGEELLAFHLGEDEDGKPNVTRIQLVIKNPMAAYYEKCWWSWPQIDDGDEYNNVGEEVSSSNSNEDENQHQEEMEEEEENQHQQAGEEENQHQEEEEEESDDDDDEAAVINSDGAMSDNEGWEHEYYKDHDVPYDAEDEIIIGRYLVRSVSGDELLLVRHEHVSCPYSDPYTRKVEVLKADVGTGRWVSVTANDGLGKGEAVFLSRSFSKSTRARGGDVEEGLVCYASCSLDDVFDTRSWTIRKMTFGWPWQRKLVSGWWLTWLFPPELVV